MNRHRAKETAFVQEKKRHPDICCLKYLQRERVDSDGTPLKVDADHD